MCQHSQGESDYLVWRERQERLRKIKQDGYESFHRGIPRTAHLHAARVKKDAAPGRFYSEEWFRQESWYGPEIEAWERGWDKAQKESSEGA